MARVLPQFHAPKHLPLLSRWPTEQPFMTFQSASAVADVTDFSGIDEISGFTALSGHTSNIGMFAAIDDSVADKVFLIDREGDSQGEITLTGISWTDAEAMGSYTSTTDNKRYLVIGEIGDNGAVRSTKTFIRFEEPLVTGSDITIAAVDVEEIVVQFPASPTFVQTPGAGTNRGDSEAFFVCPIDEKIYLMSKREIYNRIYSLPLQTSYTGTQTLTYEGEMNSAVAALTSTGPSSPTPMTNATDAAISTDGKSVLIKTYDKVYQFYRSDTSIPWSTIMQNQTPIEDPNYVGLGAGPSQEPQGEALTFDANDTGYYTTSEYSGSPGSLPIYYYAGERVLKP